MTEEKSNQMERKLTNEGTTKFIHVVKTGNGCFFGFSRYVSMELPEIISTKKGCERLITGYYRPKKENN